MIGRLRGIILEKHPPQVLLETQGVGYEVQMPMTCFYALPETGQEAIIFTCFVVREDAQVLFGFIHRQERVLFRELIKVSGVGPKLALAILSGMPTQKFVNAVVRQEINALITLPGVGKKTAARLVVEMRDRFKSLPSDLFAMQGMDGLLPSAVMENKFLANPESEAVAALVALGYKSQEACRMVSKVARTGADCEVLIRDALRDAL